MGCTECGTVANSQLKGSESPIEGAKGTTMTSSAVWTLLKPINSFVDHSLVSGSHPPTPPYGHRTRLSTQSAHPAVAAGLAKQTKEEICENTSRKHGEKEACQAEKTRKSEKHLLDLERITHLEDERLRADLGLQLGSPTVPGKCQ